MGFKKRIFKRTKTYFSYFFESSKISNVNEIHKITQDVNVSFIQNVHKPFHKRFSERSLQFTQNYCRVIVKFKIYIN